jgi:hypothetical protein
MQLLIREKKQVIIGMPRLQSWEWTLAFFFRAPWSSSVVIAIVQGCVAAVRAKMLAVTAPLSEAIRVRVLSHLSVSGLNVTIDLCG